MKTDSNETVVARFATLLFHQLKASIPRPGTDFHKYSRGWMFANLKMYVTATGFRLELSTGVPYSHYAMGYKDDGSRRNPRGKREVYNFQIVDRCLKNVANIIASSVGGEIYYG